MNATFNSRIGSIHVYSSPEEAIDGIVKDTEEAAKEFSPTARKHVETHARELAATAKRIITKLATELSSKTEQLDAEARDKAASKAMAENWSTAESMRRLCLHTLDEAWADEESKKLGDLNSKIKSASIAPLAPSAQAGAAFGRNEG